MLTGGANPFKDRQSLVPATLPPLNKGRLTRLDARPGGPEMALKEPAEDHSMRLVIERGELLRALGHVTSVVERRTTIPILSNVLLRARESTLEFKATDLEREVIEGVAADVSAPGAVTVPAHMLHDIVRKLPDGSQVDIRKDAEKERLTLAAGHARFALQTLPAEDFPDIGVWRDGP